MKWVVILLAVSSNAWAGYMTSSNTLDQCKKVSYGVKELKNQLQQSGNFNGGCKVDKDEPTVIECTNSGAAFFAAVTKTKEDCKSKQEWIRDILKAIHQ